MANDKSQKQAEQSSDTLVVAARILRIYWQGGNKADVLCEKNTRLLSPLQSRSIRRIVYGTLRHLSLIEQLLQEYLKKTPPVHARSILVCACAEMLLDPTKRFQIVDSAVEIIKTHTNPYLGRMANAVLRKVGEQIDSGSFAQYSWPIQYSHPQWLLSHWLSREPEEKVKCWLEWNQTPPELYMRDYASRAREPTHKPSGIDMEAGEMMIPTQWPHFYRIGEVAWSEVHEALQGHYTYLQDPSTRYPLSLLDPQPGERILDLCAAPGGKSFGILHALHGKGSLTSVDLPTRTTLLHENLSRTGWNNWEIIEADLTKKLPDRLQSLQNGCGVDAVLLDAPCSNTGVLRRRPDVKWRLVENDIQQMADCQLQLLQLAANYVAPKGRLVYSTCSLEPEENQHVVEAFLASSSGNAFTLKHAQLYDPHSHQHDGGAAFLLTKHE
mgnify:CR=1 FL=1